MLRRTCDQILPVWFLGHGVGSILTRPDFWLDEGLLGPDNSLPEGLKLTGNPVTGMRFLMVEA